MTARPATLADYGRLYAGKYMERNWRWRAEGIEALLRGDRRIIEVGAGRGQLADHMRTQGYDWTAVDPHPTGAGVARAALPHLPFLARSFDCSVTVDVLEHIDPHEITAALAALRRIARRGVWAVANMSDVHLVDGVPTELHLIQRPADWWCDQVRSLGGVAEVHPTDTPIRFWLEVSW